MTFWHPKNVGNSTPYRRKMGANIAQKSVFCAERNWTIRSVSFDTVQRFLVRTSRHSLVVRPHTLTPYVLTPFERTSPEPTPYVQRIFGRRIWCFVPYGCYFFTLREARICSCGQPRWILSHSQGVSECQNESKMRKSDTKSAQKACWYGRGHSQGYYRWVSFKRIIN